MRIGTNSGKLYSLSTKKLLKGVVRWFIKFLYINIGKLEKYLIKKINEWEID